MFGLFSHDSGGKEIWHGTMVGNCCVVMGHYMVLALLSPLLYIWFKCLSHDMLRLISGTFKGSKNRSGG